MEKKLKVVIVSPHGKAGGIIVLHHLCRLLTEQNVDARMFYCGDVCYPKCGNLFWIKWLRNFLFFSFKQFLFCVLKRISKTDLVKHNKHFSLFFISGLQGCKCKYLPFVSKKTIVIYPEIYYYNFLNARRVIRWLLYYNRYPKDSYWGHNNEVIITYRKQFNDNELNPECKVLKINYFDTQLYQHYNYGERSGICYILRKGKKRVDLPEKFDGIIVDDLSEEEKVKVFNRSKICYSYDTQTFYSTIASLCGCISVVVVEQGKSRSDYLSEGDYGYGVAYGDTPEEITFAEQTKDKMIEELGSIEVNNKKNIDNFLNFISGAFV